MVAYKIAEQLFGENLNRNSSTRLVRLSVIAALLVITLFVTLQSNVNPIAWTEPWTDSGVFRYVALEMSGGGIPYRDTFDHKGPLLYLLNFLGKTINPIWGVWVIEFVATFVAILAMYGISKLWSGHITSLVVVCAACSSLIMYWEGGNLVEEYALSYTALALLVILEFLLARRINRKSCVAAGASFAAVCLLRANMAVSWFCLCPAVAYVAWKELGPKKTLTFCGWFLAGVTAISLPILGWLAINGAWVDFIRDYLIFNAMYSSDGVDFAARFSSWNYFVRDPMVLASMLLYVYWAITRRDEIVWPVLFVTLLASSLSVAMSGRTYGHYGQVLVPFVVPALSNLGKSLFSGEWDENKNTYHIATSVLVVMLVLMGIPRWKMALENIASELLSAGNNVSEEFAYTVNEITSRTNETDRITVCGNCDALYVLSGRLSSSKYSYQYPIAVVDPSILEAYFKDLKNDNPAIIVKTAYSFDEEMDGFIEENGYTQTADVGNGIFLIYAKEDNTD